MVRLILEDRKNDETCFQSSVHPASYLAGGILTFACFVITIAGFFDGGNVEEKKYVTALFALFTVFMAVNLLNTLVVTSDIVVNDFGIGRLIFGRLVRQLQWQKIQAIRVHNVRDYDNPLILKNVAVYRLDAGNLHGFFLNDSLVISEKYIKNIRSLLDAINVHSTNNGIEIRDYRTDQKGQLMECL